MYLRTPGNRLYLKTFFSRGILFVIQSKVMHFPLRFFPGVLLCARLPALTGWLFLSCGIVLGYFLPITPSPEPIVYSNFLLYAMIFSCIAAIVVPLRFIRCAAFLVLGILVAQHDGVLRNREYSAWRLAYNDTREYTLSGRLSGIPCANRGGYSFTVKADSLVAALGPGVFKNKSILCYASQKPPAYGAVALTGSFRAPRARENPEDFNEYLYSLSNGIWGTFYVKSMDSTEYHRTFFTSMACAARTLTVKALASVTNEEYRGILLAAFLNDQSELSSAMKKLFFQAGIYHLLALSGFNIALVAGALFVLLMPLPLRREWKIIILLLLIWLYLFFVGFIPSLFRAVIMATIVGASYLLQRKNYALNSLGLAAIVWLFLSPLSLFTPGFQLSFAATFGLITLSPLLSAWIPNPASGLLRKAFGPLIAASSVSLASFIATLPILIYHFKQVYLFGLFANLFAVALMAAAMWFGLAGFLAQLIFPPLVAACMQAAQLCIHIMIQMAGLVRFVPWTNMTVSIPYPEAYLAFAVFVIAAIVVENRYRKKLIAVLLPLFIVFFLMSLFFHGQEQKMQVVFFKTRGAGLTGIQWPNKQTWILGIGEEKYLKFTGQRIVLPWLSGSGRTVTKIFLPHYQSNVVHFLDPIVSLRHAWEAAYSDTLYDHDDNFKAFVHNNGGKMVRMRNGEKVSAAPQCTCTLIEKIKNGNAYDVSFIIRAFNSVVYISIYPNPLSAVRTAQSAQVFTLRKNKPIKIEVCANAFYIPEN